MVRRRARRPAPTDRRRETPSHSFRAGITSSGAEMKAPDDVTTAFYVKGASPNRCTSAPRLYSIAAKHRRRSIGSDDLHLHVDSLRAVPSSCGWAFLDG